MSEQAEGRRAQLCKAVLEEMQRERDRHALALEILAEKYDRYASGSVAVDAHHENEVELGLAVRVYLTEREIDGHRYGDHICARSREEADELAAKLGGTCLGSLEEIQCGQCGNVLSGGSEPPLSPNEWPDDEIREVP